MNLNKSKAFATQEGKCPESEGKCEFKISTEKIKWLHKYGPDDKFYNLQNVPFAINNPRAIFKGLKRDGHETSFCYAAKPARRFIDDTNSEPLRAGFIFLVFVCPNLEIFNWRFERAESGGTLPENHVARFTKLIWEKQH